MCGLGQRVLNRIGNRFECVHCRQRKRLVPEFIPMATQHLRSFNSFVHAFALPVTFAQLVTDRPQSDD